MVQSRSIKTLFLSSGRVLTALASITCAAVLARLLSKSDYASYRQTMLVYLFAAPLLASGLPQSLYYFIPRERDNSRGFLMGNLVLLFFMGALFTIFLLCGGNRLIADKFSNPSLSHLLIMYSPYALLALPLSNISACLMSLNKVRTLVIYNVASSVLTVTSVIVSVIIWRTPAASIIATVISQMIVCIPAVFLMYKSTSGSWKFSLENLSQQIRYGIPLGLGEAIGKIDISLDKIIVAVMCAPELFAIYVNGAVEIPVIGIITGSITAVLLPDLVKYYNQNEKSQAIDVWKRAAIKSSMVLFPIMCFFMAMAPELIQLLFSSKYAQSANAFRAYLLLLPIRVVTWGSLIMAAGKTRLVLYNMTGGLVINLMFSVILVYRLGYMGAVWGTVLSMYLWTVPFYFQAISKLYNIKYSNILPFRDLAKVLTVSLIALLPCGFKTVFTIPNVVAEIAVFGFLYSALLLALMSAFKLITKTEILSVYSRGRADLLTSSN